MHTNEWSLVLFTLFVQASIGVLVLAVTARNVTGSSCARLFSWQVTVSCGLAAMGLLFSVTHLGTPVHAVFTILNIGTSWLSREILLTGFYGLAVLALTVRLIGKPDSNVRGLSLLTAAIGLLALVAMSNVYLLPTVPVWNSMATVLGFFGAALLPGAVVTGLLLAVQMRRAKRSSSARLAGILCSAAGLGLIMQLAGLVYGVAVSGTAYNATLIERFAASDVGLGMLIGQMVLLFAGSILFAWTTLAARSSGYSRVLMRLGVCALGCVLAGEALGRLMFYGSYWRVGL
ncbi:MAG: dimethyl sulfoxide reductase anchor subunit family protein [Solidesulfovibrio sp.]